MIKNYYILTFIIYIFLFIDSRLNVPIFGGYYIYSLFYLLSNFFIVFLIYSRSRKGKKVNSLSLKATLLFVVVYFFSFFLSSKSEMLELAVSVVFFLNIYCTGYIIYYFELNKMFLTMSYYIPSIFVSILFFKNNVSFDLNYYFDNLFLGVARGRINMGFTHYNILGNICACMLLLSVLMCATYEKKNGCIFSKLIMYGSVIFLDIILLITLMATASRSSFLLIIVFLAILMCIKLLFEENDNKRNKLLMYILLFTLTVIISVFIGGFIIDLFISSERLNNILINIPLLTKNNRWLIGLGIIDPGKFSYSASGYGYSYYVDNYYLYILIETGIIGFIIILSIMLKIGKVLHRLINQKICNENIIIYAIYFTHLISGMAETCVIYHNFMSSFIFMSLYYIKCNSLGEIVQEDRSTHENNILSSSAKQESGRRV